VSVPYELFERPSYNKWRRQRWWWWWWWYCCCCWWWSNSMHLRL